MFVNTLHSSKCCLWSLLTYYNKACLYNGTAIDGHEKFTIGLQLIQHSHWQRQAEVAVTSRCKMCETQTLYGTEKKLGWDMGHAPIYFRFTSKPNTVGFQHFWGERLYRFRQELSRWGCWMTGIEWWLTVSCFIQPHWQRTKAKSFLCS